MWFTYVLISAVLSGVCLILNKRLLRDVNTSVLTFVLFVFPLPILLVMLFLQGIPRVEPRFYIAVTASSVVFLIAKMLSLKMQKNYETSVVAPFFSFGPFFAFLIALVFLNERIGITQMAGIALTIFGMYLIHLDKNTKHVFDPFRRLVKSRMSLILLGAMFLSGIASVLDKTAITSLVPASATYMLFVEFIIQAIAISAYVTYKKIPLISQIRKNLKLFVIISVLYTALSVFVLTGFATGPVALVTSVKKLEIVFALLLGFVFFKDKPTKYVLAALPIILLGTVLIKL